MSSVQSSRGWARCVVRVSGVLCPTRSRGAARFDLIFLWLTRRGLVVHSQLDFPLGETSDSWIVHSFTKRDYLETFADNPGAIYGASSIDEAMMNTYRTTRALRVQSSPRLQSSVRRRPNLDRQ